MLSQGQGPKRSRLWRAAARYGSHEAQVRLAQDSWAHPHQHCLQPPVLLHVHVTSLGADTCGTRAAVCVQTKLNRGLDFINLDDILVDLKLGPEVLEVGRGPGRA